MNMMVAKEQWYLDLALIQVKKLTPRAVGTHIGTSVFGGWKSLFSWRKNHQLHPLAIPRHSEQWAVF